MTLMRLAPETTRLRRLARAYAVGELTQAQYRSERRAIIGSFYQRAQSDEDTQRRGQIGFTTSEQSTTVASAAPRQDPPTILGLRRWLWPLLVLLLLGLIVQSSWGDTIGHPSERDPNPLTSPRVSVSQVSMQPSTLDAQVSTTAVQLVINEKLAEIRARHAPGEHGFTDAELNELGRFLNAVGVGQPNTQLSTATAADLVALVEDQRAKRGISIAELEELAAAVQDFYRNEGYFLAVVVLPPQSPTAGQVQLQLLPGVLSDLAIRGSDPALVRGAFVDLIGKALHQSDVETRFSELREQTGLKAQLSFKPGTESGTSILDVDILQQRRWSALARLDNHGLDSTGKDRVAAEVAWLNPRRAGDRLRLQFLSSFDPADQQYVGVDYSTLVGGGAYQLNGYVGNNRFDPGLTLGALDLEGDSLLMEIELAKTHLRSRSRGLRSALLFGHHRLSWDDLDDQSVWLVHGGLSGHRVWDAKRIYVEFEAGAELGVISEGRFSGQDSRYWRIDSHLFAWKPWDLPYLPGVQKIALRIDGLLAGSELPATRALALGGPAGNRAFDRASFFADTGIEIGVELRTQLPVGEGLFFLDSAYGTGDNNRNDSWAQLTSVGLGWDADWGERFTSRLSWALPVGADSSSDLDEKGARFYWTLQYAY